MKQILQKLKKVDALLVTNLENIAYLTGFSGSAGALLLKENPILFVDGRYLLQAKEEARDCEIVCPKDSFWEGVANRIKEEGIKRLGFEERNLNYQLYRTLRRMLKGVSLVPLRDIVERERMIKADWEIERMKRSLALTEEALSHCLSILREGIREEEVALELEWFVRKRGGSLAFPSIIAFGERSALPHAKPTSRELRKGDVVLIDAGARVDSYCSDITRTFFWGKPSEDLLRIYSAVLSAQEKALEAIREGKKVGEIDEEARGALREQGLAEYFTHSLGHGVGREVHEMPSLAPNSKEKLVASMVVTIEPGVYMEGLGGVRIEDMVVVGKDSPQILTKFTKEILIL